MTHVTQMDAARQGILTPQVQQVLADETIHEADLLARVAEGRIAIPANRNHLNLIAKGIGASSQPVDQDVCTMCGDPCAVK